jgi:dimeric dUTPase (all-alpha-NTP-PPase superfamily)
MYKFLVTKEELSTMLEMQEELNCKYNVVEWRKIVKQGNAKFALLDEVSEFLREIESNWKWWKNPVDCNYNKQRALFELIDVIHFAMLLCLHKTSLSTNKDLVNLMLDSIGSFRLMYGKVNDQENQFVKSITNFMGAVDNYNEYNTVCGLINIINNGGILIDLKPGEIYQAYLMKNARNHNRVTGGIMTGDYDKSKEEELIL